MNIKTALSHASFQSAYISQDIFTELRASIKETKNILVYGHITLNAPDLI